MTDKFFPTYELEIETSNGSIVIPSDDKRYFNIEATVNYSYSESPNTCDITIYNLNKTSRDAIFFDAWDYFTFRKMTFKAGYGGNLQMLFNGNIKEAYSDRSGADVQTKVSGWDNFWYNNNYINETVQAGASRGKVIDTILQSIDTGQGVAKLIRSKFEDEDSNLRSEALKGRPQDLIKERIPQDASLFFDDNKIFVLKDNDAIGKEGNIPLINSETGLLGVPIKRNRIVEFKMIFEPSLRIGRAFELQSSFSDKLNGVYKVLSVSHSLSLGENMGGENVTTVRAWNSNQGFNFIGMF